MPGPDGIRTRSTLPLAQPAPADGVGNAQPVAPPPPSPPDPPQTDPLHQSNFGSSAPATNPTGARALPTAADGLVAANLQLDHSSEFHRLQAGTQQQVRQLLVANRNNPAACTAIADVASGAGFASLGPDAQNRALRAMAAAPTETMRWDLINTMESPNFRHLDASAQNQILDAFARLAHDDTGRNALAEMAQSQGLGELQPWEQSRVLNLVTGDNPIASGGRATLARSVASPEWSDPTRQAGALRGLLTHNVAGSITDTTAQGTFDHRSVPFTVQQPPRSIPSFNFRGGGAAPASEYTVDVGGRSMRVVVPRNASGANIPTADQVSAALATLPPWGRAAVDRVVVNPGADPDDAQFTQQFHRPFRADASADSSGTVNLYRENRPVDQTELNTTMIHEAAHTLSTRAWGNNFQTGPGWASWRSAMNAEPLAISAHAMDTPGEDLAEAMAAYEEARGTPREAELRRLMPLRMQLIDQLLAEQH